ncbi:hypothetical protein Ndes2526B_g04403 [Nannochloris sp. 'desiccata']
MTEDNVRRPKRRCASRNVHTSAMPSAVHYVGYVEEDETPEMIMAKFQELERIQKAVIEAKKGEVAAVEGAAADGADAAAANGAEGNEDATATVTTENNDDIQALTDEQLLEVFKQTSMFNVKTALQDNAMLMGIDEMLDHQADRYGFEDEISDDDDLLRSFWSDDEEMFNDSGSDGEYGVNKKNKRRGAGGGSRRTGGSGRAQRNAGGVRARHNIVTAYNPDTQALVRRKVRVNDPDEIVQIRVPNAPIPLPWGRVVKPYLPRELRGVKNYAVAPVPVCETPHSTKYLEIDSLASLHPKTLDNLTYQAALINPGWDKDNAPALSALAQIPLPKLVPTGFIFIWTPKQHVQAVCKQMTKWGYIYIENLTWVYMAPNNAILKLDSEFVRKSHMTLYMFRVADKGRDIELRHQRNPDVTFECLPASSGRNCGPALAPEETFVAVETLLPTGKGQLLELWAPQGVKRPGWTHVVEVGQNES